jgi:hypothetical protein
MGDRRSARLLPELSNFYCHPGRAGGSPFVISAMPVGAAASRRRPRCQHDAQITCEVSGRLILSKAPITTLLGSYRIDGVHWYF